MLLLFDIDGTLLIRATDDHRDAVHAAVRHVWGVRDPGAAHINPAGRTDPDIARQILLLSDVAAEHIDDRMVDFKRVAVQEYAKRCRSDLSGFVAPGVTALLEQLSGREDVLLGLVTGNLEAIAERKLARAGIGRFFRPGLGGFGSDSEDRTDLPEIARRRAGTRSRPYPREDTIIIGDTPLDVACAQADGVRCFAVTTGSYDRDALRGADEIVASAEELAPLLA